jgi:hypothetical protein
VVATAGEGAGAFAAVGYDELHAASKMDTAAPAAIAYGFITVTTHEGQTWFSVRRPDLVQCDLAMPATRTQSPKKGLTRPLPIPASPVVVRLVTVWPNRPNDLTSLSARSDGDNRAARDGPPT